MMGWPMSNQSPMYGVPSNGPQQGLSMMTPPSQGAIWAFMRATASSLDDDADDTDSTDPTDSSEPSDSADPTDASMQPTNFEIAFQPAPVPASPEIAPPGVDQSTASKQATPSDQISYRSAP